MPTKIYSCDITITSAEPINPESNKNPFSITIQDYPMKRLPMRFLKLEGFPGDILMERIGEKNWKSMYSERYPFPKVTIVYKKFLSNVNREPDVSWM